MAQSYALPTADGVWTAPSEQVGRPATELVRVEIRGIGTFDVDPTDILSIRPDVFQSGRVSIFDVLVKLHKEGEIELAYHYDESMATHVVDSIDGAGRWWYEAYYSQGWFEQSVHRMDLYPIKDGTVIRFAQERQSRIDAIHATFLAEVDRLSGNDGVVIIPSVIIEGPRRQQLAFKDIEVSSHGVRDDLLQPGVITALDILLSLGEQGLIDQIGLTWYDHIFSADPVDHYFVELIYGQDFIAEAEGGCGFVYEVGPRGFRGFAGAHIHLPTDARVLVSPEYAEWFWLCL